MGALCSKWTFGSNENLPEAWRSPTTESYNVWFRHSGMKPGSSDIQHEAVQRYTAEEIQQEVGDYVITDLKLEGNLPSNIGELAPDVTNLCIREVKDNCCLHYLSQLTKLSKLDIGGNNLTTVPQAILSLKLLAELKMLDCDLHALPERLQSFTQLSILYLSGNDFSRGLPECVTELCSLKELHLESCKLSSLPDKLQSLTQLSILYLSDNDFSRGLPECVTELCSLKELHLDSCNLSSLPDKLQSLTQLSTLNLSDNDFSDGLPECVTKLCSLEELDLGRCKLSSLPDKLQSLTQLSILNLPGNDFSEGLPECVAELCSLKKLDLYACKLSSLPDELQSLTQLSILNLSVNDFSKGLPECVTKLRSLRKLNLRYCELSSLPDELQSLSLLSILNLSCNDFSEGLPECVAELCSLQELDLSECRLSSLPDQLQPLIQLSTLKLSDNDFREGLPECVAQLCSLRKLNLRYCNLSSLPDKLQSLTQLSTLNLLDNDFSEGLPECVTELCSLKELYLGRCKLSILPDKLQSLTQLSKLNLSGNDFSKGLPECVTELCSLKELDLDSCNLSSLPDKLANLRMIVNIDISRNMFEILPPVICKLSELQKLNLGSGFGTNEIIKTLDSDVLNLHNLKVINCTGCNALISPPYAVCEQGLQAIFQFYNDMKDGSGKQPIISTVAVIGELMSGKTSLIRSLMEGRRELTYRNIESVIDDTTKVFEMNELELRNNRLRIVDFGGHEVYHMAYQMTLKDNCIPLIVVNMEQYDTLRKKEKLEAKEAARRVCFNWMSHLYLSCPRLGRPFLILTHKDKFGSSEFDELQYELVVSLESLRRDFLHEQTKLGLKSDSTYILHFEKDNKLLFNLEDIFTFGNDAYHDLDTLNRLKESLDCYMEGFDIEIPQLWQQMGNYIESEIDKPFLTLSQFQKTYPEPAQLVVLRYLHNIGKVLWYEKQKSLDSYIFHQISEITDMIALLFHHKGFKEWDERVKNFKVFYYKKLPIDQDLYEKLITEFKNSGQLDDAILVHLFDGEYGMGYDTSMTILQAFNIVHGPIKLNPRPVFILPALSSKIKSPDIADEGYLQLKAEISFKGLTLPKYVYHLLTVAVLNSHDASDTISYKYAYANGAEIQHGDITTHLLHDFDNRKLLIQVSTSLYKITASWKLLVDTCKAIVSCSKENCKATQPVVRVFCSHCLFVRDPNPGSNSEIDWAYPDAHQAKQYCIGKCVKHTSSDIKPSVPSPLLAPCKNLNKRETQDMHIYLKGMERFRPNKSGTSQLAGGDITPSDPDGASSSNPLLSHQPSENQKEDEESDFSDDESFMDERDEHQAKISLDLRPCILPKIRRLFNSNSVYRMSQPIRGRCLIINNEVFNGSTTGESKLETRLGSEVDVTNITNVFKALSFECELLRNLNGLAMLDEITKETKRQEHIKYGMFILVIMSHGGEDVLYGTDDRTVKISDIYKRMHTYEFPLMAGQPRVIIIQACAGQGVDVMGQLSYDSPAHAEPNEVMRGATAEDPASSTYLHDVYRPLPGDHQSVDDIYVMKASVPGYISHRHTTHGTWFIRALVDVLYRHSGHRDLVSLFEQVRKKVRKRSMAEHRRNTNSSGQMPTETNYLIPGRKLYLFPNYNPGV